MKIIEQLEIMNQNLKTVALNQTLIYCELKAVEKQIEELQREPEQQSSTDQAKFPISLRLMGNCSI